MIFKIKIQLLYFIERRSGDFLNIKIEGKVGSHSDNFTTDFLVFASPLLPMYHFLQPFPPSLLRRGGQLLLVRGVAKRQRQPHMPFGRES